KATRAAIPSTKFALPGRRYPIENRSHAANALSRVSQFGTPAEKATVRRKVAAAYPGMGDSTPPRKRTSNFRNRAKSGGEAYAYDFRKAK
ncbi:MAG TPA: hypothetical protein VGQ30_09870, partial [Gemmatimonadaceae bacterium]|nr:hypothetical protein [Gemmatimonadaceae bacterium]